MMPEFVHADVSRPHVVDGDGRILIENSAAAISLAVDQDLDELVGRKRGDITERPVLRSQHVSFTIERVVGGAERRTTIDSTRWPRDPRFRCRRAKSPHVEIFPMLAKR